MKTMAITSKTKILHQLNQMSIRVMSTYKTYNQTMQHGCHFAGTERRSTSGLDAQRFTTDDGRR